MKSAADKAVQRAYATAHIMDDFTALEELLKPLTPRQREIFDRRYSMTFRPRSFCEVARQLARDNTTIRYHVMMGLARIAAGKPVTKRPGRPQKPHPATSQ